MIFLLLFIWILNNSNADKFCINCIHYKKTLFSNQLFGKCSIFPQEIDKDKKVNYLVSGKKNIDYIYCLTSRQDENLCGEKGKYYKKKCFLPDGILN